MAKPKWLLPMFPIEGNAQFQLEVCENRDVNFSKKKDPRMIRMDISLVGHTQGDIS